jgi:hypothetical protein
MLSRLLLGKIDSLFEPLLILEITPEETFASGTHLNYTIQRNDLPADLPCKSFKESIGHPRDNIPTMLGTVK